jgi:leucyl aminopeptidase (aminopeptidase T)
VLRRLDASIGVKILVDTCLNIRPHENVLIVTDTNMCDIAELMAYVASERETVVTITTMSPLPAPGMEPPKPVAAAMKAAEVVLMLTTFTLTPSKARQEAQEAGARILSLGGYSYDILVSKALRVDFMAQKPLVEDVARRLTQSKHARVTSASGTDLILTLGSREAHASSNICHTSGTLGSPPDIEAYVAPIEDTAEGVVVIDGSICLEDFGLIREPIKLIVVKGRVVDIEGDEEATKFKNKLDSFNDSELFRIAELGIGLNPKASLIGDPLIDEGVLGTAHVALGLNFTYGGTISDAKTHIDCVFRKPTIELDGEFLMKDGVLIGGVRRGLDLK